jgi:hypothetical protein
VIWHQGLAAATQPFVSISLQFAELGPEFTAKGPGGADVFLDSLLFGQAEALPVGFGALAPERHLDTFFVVPPEIAVEFIDELGYGNACP